MPEESTALKHLFGLELANKYATIIQSVYPLFQTKAFIAQVAKEVDALELKDRMALLATTLRDHLPSDYLEALPIILKTLGPETDEDDKRLISDFQLMPIAHFVEYYGLDHFDESINALYEITKRSTSEFAIRPFLIRYPERTLAILREWATDDNHHVRRLVSEGMRPRLPWTSQLPDFIADPSPVLNMLELLKNDESQYVQKSVANNLNDITKDHPDLVLECLTRWNQNASDSTRWIIRHALRTLIKNGDPEALALLGYSKPQVALENLQLSPETMQLGETLSFSFTLKSTSDESQDLMIDYLVHFVRAKGKTNAKVFKLKTVTLNGGESINIQKNHPIKPITVRRYYSGAHRIEIQVNGLIVGSGTFDLIV
jgi:3-methyladenine DNA glycosylase AlkC